MSKYTSGPDFSFLNATPRTGLEGFQQAINESTTLLDRYLERENAKEERKTREAEDLRRFELQQARYKLEDDRYNRKEKMLLDKEAKAEGGEQALANINEIAKTSALSTNFGQSIVKEAEKVRGRAFNTSVADGATDAEKEAAYKDTIELGRLGELALSAAPRDEILRIAAPSFAAYGIDPKNVLGGLEVAEAGQDYDKLALAANTAQDKKYSQEMQQAGLLRGATSSTDADGNIVYYNRDGSTRSGSSGSNAPKDLFSDASKTNNTTFFGLFNLKDSDASHLSEFQDKVINTLYNSGEKIDRGALSRAAEMLASEKVANKQWGRDDKGNITSGSMFTTAPTTEGGGNDLSKLLAMYNKEKSNTPASSRTELNVPDIPDRISAAILKQNAERTASARLRELYPSLNSQPADRLTSSTNSTLVTSPVVPAASNVSTIAPAVETIKTEPTRVDEPNPEVKLDRYTPTSDSNRTTTNPTAYIATPDSSFGLFADMLAKRGVYAPKQTQEVVVGDDGVPRYTGKLVDATPPDSLVDKVVDTINRLPLVTPLGVAGVGAGLLNQAKNVGKAVDDVKSATAGVLQNNKLVDTILNNRDKMIEAEKSAALRNTPISRRDVVGPKKPEITTSPSDVTVASPREIFIRYSNALPDVSIPSKIAALEAKLGTNISKAEKDIIEKSIAGLKARQLVSTKTTKELDDTRATLDRLRGD